MLEHLRQACNDWHEKLHRHPLLAALNGGEIDRESYGKILQAFYLAYTEMEANRTQPAPGDVPDAPALKWLAADFDYLQLKPREQLLRTDALPSISSLSSLYGYLYVKQGSTLGGQVISKHLQKALGLRPGIDNHFFNGYGPDTGPNWKKFCRNLEQQSPNLDQNAVIATAVAAFRAIDQSCTVMLDGAAA